jgi:DnaJ family protein C protein 7
MEDYEGAVRDFKESLAACGVEGNAKEESALKTELRKAEADMKRSKTKDYYKILG